MFVLDDGEPGYGALMATAFETAAGRVGLDVVGRAVVGPAGDALRRSSRAGSRRSGASAVYRRRAPRHERGSASSAISARGSAARSILIGPSGLSPIRSAGQEVRDGLRIGMYVSFAGMLTEGLPPAGAHWVDALRCDPAGRRGRAGARSTRRRRRRCCWTRSRARTGRGRLSSKSCSGPNERDGLLGSVRLRPRTATSPRAPSRSCGVRAPRNVATRS